MLLVMLLILVSRNIGLVVCASFVGAGFRVVPGVLSFRPAFGDGCDFMGSSICGGAKVSTNLLFRVVLFTVV